MSRRQVPRSKGASRQAILSRQASLSRKREVHPLVPADRTSRPSKNSPPLNRFALYTLCAQNPPRDARLLRAIHADQSRGIRRPGLLLGEDFSGAAALSRAWCDLDPASGAVAVDRDGEPLAHAAPNTRTRLVHADVLRCRAPVDLIAALNFSICELHDRATLLAYLRHARSRLTRRGCIVCDLYGGADAFATGTLWQSVRAANGERVRYGWEQRTADPLTGRVVNAMHFEVLTRAASPRSRAGDKKPAARPKDRYAPAASPAQPSRQLRDAFVYDWRLWSVPELRDAMREAGFATTAIYPRTAGATDAEGLLYTAPIDDPHEVGEAFNVFVVASAHAPRRR